MGGGSGGGSKQKSEPRPQQAQPIDYAALMQASSAAARAQVDAQFADSIKYYPDQERQQLGTIQNIGTLLSPQGGTMKTWVKDKKGNWTQQEIGTAAPDTYTTGALAATQDALAQRANLLAQANSLADTGNYISQAARDSYATSGPTAIEAELNRQALSDLSLGRALNPEEIRNAQQSSRAAYEARGMGTGSAAAASEILARDGAAQARESNRRNFAAATNSMLMSNVIGRRDQAAQQAALGANVTGNASTGYNQVAALGFQGANTLVGIDPISRAISPGIGLGSSVQGNGMQMIGNTYANASNMAGNVASFNANMLDSRYNAWANNQAALQGAQMQSGATAGASKNAMLGSGLAAGGAILGGVAIAI